LPAVLAVTLALVLAGCTGGGRFERDDAQINAAPASEPGVNELMIPELLEPTLTDGVAQFDLSIGASSHDFGSGAATDTIAYNEQPVLGPTMRWASGDDVEVRVTNTLAEATTAHWHGADVPAEADGGPHGRIDPGQTWVAEFPVIQPAATLWYHPHLMGTSAEQVFAGAAGMIIVDDDNPLAADLPGTYGVDDIPVIMQDREFAADGQLAFEIDDGGDGDLNPNLTVNGTLDAYTTVPAGPVRLRLLNGSQARVYELSVSNGSMVKIASDGGYLAGPVPLDTLTLGPGDRAEIIVDTTDGPATLIDADFGRVLELRTDPDLPTAQPPPPQLATIDAITVDEIDRDRVFLMGRVDGGWGINGEQMDMSRIDETITFGDTERWTITVRDGVHTFHPHQTQFQILEINGQPPPPEDAGWEDTVLVTEDADVVIAARFDSYTNPDTPYMFHCHVLDHEHLGMMGQFRVVEN
jgi:FtsP/CotA-like multicopper oxidase with cupredoxin domain